MRARSRAAVLATAAGLLGLTGALLAITMGAGQGEAGMTSGASCFTLATSVSSGSGTILRVPTSAGSCPTGSYPYGYVVTVSGSPSPGWILSSWSGTDNDFTNPTSVTMYEDRSISATFTSNCYALTTSVVSGNGSISVSPQSSGGCSNRHYSPSTVVTLSGITSSPWSLSGWTGTDNDSANPTSVTMTGNKNVTATFTSNCVALTLGVASGSGSVSAFPPSAGGCPFHQYPPGYIVALQATAGAGWIFDHWTGADNNNTSSSQVSMFGNQTVAATFRGNCYTLTIVVNGSGSVQTSPNSSGACPFHQYSHNQLITLSVTPASGYTLYGWDGTDNDFLLTTSVTMTGSRTVTATFIVIGGPTPTLAPPTATPTRTPVPTLPPGTPTGVVGDVDCNYFVNSIDAALTLQLVAGLVASLPCPENADADETGSITSIDSALMLQVGAGLLASLPPT